MGTKEEIKGSKELEKDVIQEGLCTLCGACVGMCPYNVAFQGRLVVVENCNLDQGRCYAFCPRTGLDLDSVNRTLFAVPYASTSLGTMQEIFIARSTEEKVLAKAQYGGVVTSLLKLAMARGQIDSAVLTKSDSHSLPRGFLASSAEEVIACAGANYAAAPTLEALNRTPKGNGGRVAVVGVPCQMQALGKIRSLSNKYESNIGKVELTIGLFCTWAVDYEKLYRFLRKDMNIPQIKKFDIPPPPANIFQVHTEEGVKEYSLDPIREFIRPGCRTCIDMTAEFADVSLGAAEGIVGWNTVIVRSERGKALVESGKAQGVIQTKPLPSANLKHLEEASLIKKRRGLENIKQKTHAEADLSYLTPSKNKVEAFLKTS